MPARAQSDYPSPSPRLSPCKLVRVWDRSGQVCPDGDAGEDVWAILRDAILRSGKVALSRVVFERRERAVAIMPMGGGLVVHYGERGARPEQRRRGDRPPAEGQDGCWPRS